MGKSEFEQRFSQEKNLDTCREYGACLKCPGEILDEESSKSIFSGNFLRTHAFLHSKFWDFSIFEFGFANIWIFAEKNDVIALIYQ